MEKPCKTFTGLTKHSIGLPLRLTAKINWVLTGVLPVKNEKKSCKIITGLTKHSIGLPLPLTQKTDWVSTGALSVQDTNAI